MSRPDPLARLRADVRGGAASVARRAARILEREARDAPAASAAELADRLADTCSAVLDAQPAMAPLVTLAREVLAAFPDGGSLPAARSRAAAAARRFHTSSRGRVEAVAARAAAALPQQGGVLTLSASSAVERALRIAAQERPLTVVCLESRPLYEGRRLAGRLASAGISVTLAVDAALEALLPGCGALLIGADSIGDAGVVNKVGSLAAAHSARRLGIPLLVAADSSKLLPPGFPQPLADHRPASQVWRGAPPSLGVWNRYFEAVPLDLIAAWIAESRTFGPTEVERARRELEVPPALRARLASPR